MKFEKFKNSAAETEAKWTLGLLIIPCVIFVFLGELRETLLPPCEFRGLNSGQQARQQASLSAESSLVIELASPT